MLWGGIGGLVVGACARAWFSYRTEKGEVSDVGQEGIVRDHFCSFGNCAWKCLR